MADDQNNNSNGANAGDNNNQNNGGGNGNGAPENTQQKVEGKNNDEIVKMYAEAQKKLGEQGSELEMHRDFTQKANVMLAAIAKDPSREGIVKKWIEELNKTDDDGENKDKKQDNSELLGVKNDIEDQRSLKENEIVDIFNATYGLNKLEPDQRKAMNTKVGVALQEIVDPLGKFENYKDMIRSIPLSRLSKVLDNAFFLANKNAIESGEIKVPTVTPGAMGQMSSSAGQPEDPISLTADEKKAAAGMGITEDKYLENKKKILEEK
jgi:hypothetical protein